MNGRRNLPRPPITRERYWGAFSTDFQGGRDYQSTEEDFQLWQEALGEKEGVTMKLYPALNHLFAPGTGKATPTEYASEVKHVDPEVIRDLTQWILAGRLPIS